MRITNNHIELDRYESDKTEMPRRLPVSYLAETLDNFYYAKESVAKRVADVMHDAAYDLSPAEQIQHERDLDEFNYLNRIVEFLIANELSQGFQEIEYLLWVDNLTSVNS